RWKRRDGGDRKFWDKLIDAGNISMQQWLTELKRMEQNGIDGVLEGYKQHLDEALTIGVGRQGPKKKNKSKLLVWNADVYQTICDEKKAYGAWIEDKDNPQGQQELKRAKRRRKKAVRKHKRVVDQKI